MEDQQHVHEVHGHDHGLSEVSGIKFIAVVLLNVFITIAQFIGGIYSGSLALISDAIHNLSDVLSIMVSYVAIKISLRPKDEKQTFGYKRTTILAAFINSAVLIGISVLLIKEAYVRFLHPEPINGLVVIWLAAFGIVANALGAFLLFSGSKESMNIKSAYLHLFSDALSSVAVVIGGIVIYFYKLYWVDALMTVLISLYIIRGSYQIIKEATNILMQGTPRDLDISIIAKELEEIDGIVDIHHVHIWSIDEKNINFEAHANVKDVLVSDTKQILSQIEEKLNSQFHINHVTIQFEHESCKDTGVIA